MRLVQRYQVQPMRMRASAACDCSTVAASSNSLKTTSTTSHRACSDECAGPADVTDMNERDRRVLLAACSTRDACARASVNRFARRLTARCVLTLNVAALGSAKLDSDVRSLARVISPASLAETILEQLEEARDGDSCNWISSGRCPFRSTRTPANRRRKGDRTRPFGVGELFTG